MKRAVVLGVLLAACSDGKHSRPIPVGMELAQLSHVASCGDLLEELRRNALAQMSEQLDRNLQTALQTAGAGRCYAEDGAMNAPGAAKTAGASEFSTTNNQVAGVDEADFVKNDATWIYLLANGQLQIMDALPPESSRIVSRTAIEGTPLKLFVEADTAVVYSSLPGLADKREYPDAPWGASQQQAECTYGYDCDFTGDGHPMKVTVLDLRDPAQPRLLRELRFSGSFINARRIADAVHTVVAFPEILFPGLKYWPEDLPVCGGTALDEAALRARFTALREANAKAIEAATLTDWLPSIVDTRYVDGQPHTETGLLSDCRNFYASQIDDGKSFLSLVSFDLRTQSALSVSTIVGRPGAVYASASALYVAPRHQAEGGRPWFWSTDVGPEEATSIHKFALTKDAHNSYVGSGAAKGRVLNQFAMDEHEGTFRIATTTGHLPSADVHSTLSVLTESAGALVEIGRLDHLAPSEDIRSVRYDGERAFLVTFKKTDPLFVIDLADPGNPRVAGELKIPGFSTYLHMMDDRHLLSIGYDADDHGSFAFFDGVQLQIFDIGDPAAPTLVHKTIIGTRGSSSEALTNHLAFNYFAPKQLLAIPMTVCEGGGDGQVGAQMTFSGLMLYRVTVQDGFFYRGGLAHQPPEIAASYSSACYHWWSDGSSTVKRSVVMDDYVFSVAEDMVKIARIETPTDVLRSIPLK